ncbi:MAG: flagellar M-ring protein FliF [Spirochaetes bacterium]|nr:flagellar M-ring protein FliF [Spirochaetota bacterium]
MNRLQELWKRLSEAFVKLPGKQKAIAGGVLAVAVAAVAFTLLYSKKSPESLLLQRPLTPEQYAVVTKTLQDMKVSFTTKDDKYVMVKDEATARTVRMKLVQENKMPAGIKGWELFDMQKWTTTEFDRNVNLRRAIEGEMQKHLQSLEWVESAKVTLTMPNRSLYTEKDKPVTAAVTLVPSPGFTELLKDKKVVKGVERIIALGIDGITRENITISDGSGRQINDFTDDEYENHIKQAIEENRIKDRERAKIEDLVRTSLLGVLPADRYKVAVDLELSFDRKQYEQKDILPIVVKPRTPGLAYDDSRVLDTLHVSRKKTKESYKGQGHVPEGPPGQEPNLPPGYKEQVSRWNTYNKDEDIENFVNGEKRTSVVAGAVEIRRKSVSVIVDGDWKKELDAEGKPLTENDGFKRRYIPYPTEDLQKLADTVRGAINYDGGRGDLVVVRNVPFDRGEQFRKEDEAYLKQRRLERTMLYSLLGLIGIFVLSIAWRLIRQEMIRRQRLRERELARQRQMQRDEALRALETDTPVETLSEADKKRMDLQERAEQLAAERPEDVAKLIRSWIAEE